MRIEDLKKDYDKLQVKYGAKELDSIYNGGCEENPDICFVFMNPTGKNIASDKFKPQVGVLLNKQIGDKISSGELLATLYFDGHIDNAVKARLYDAFEFTSKQPKKEKLVYKIIE